MTTPEISREKQQNPTDQSIDLRNACANDTPADPDLLEVVNGWANLSPKKRWVILGIIRG